MDGQQHRQLQLALRAVTLRQLLTIWPAFDPDRLDDTWPGVREAVTALILLRRNDSVGLASAYYQNARYQAGITGTAPVVHAPAPLAEQLALSLDVVGLYGARHLAALGRKDVGAQTLVKVAGAVGRHVLNGGRDTVLASTRADPRARGWERIASGNACDFCTLLADRGGVFSEESASFEAHDHCGCGSAPVFA